MSQYANLKAAIAANVYQNHNNEVTANMVKAAMNAMTDSLGAGYQYLGIATPDTAPGTPDQRVFYIAAQPGTYTNFSGLVVNDGEVAILKWDTAWHKEVTGAATAAQVTELGQKVEYLGVSFSDLSVYDYAPEHSYILAVSKIFYINPVFTTRVCYFSVNKGDIHLHIPKTGNSVMGVAYFCDTIIKTNNTPGFTEITDKNGVVIGAGTSAEASYDFHADGSHPYLAVLYEPASGIPSCTLGKSTLVERVDEVEEKVDVIPVLEENSIVFQEQLDIMNYGLYVDIIPQKKYGTTGILEDNSSFSSTTLVLLDTAHDILVSLLGTSNRIVFFDENKAFVGYIDGVNSFTLVSKSNYPSGAVWCAFSYETSLGVFSTRRERRDWLGTNTNIRSRTRKIKGTRPKIYIQNNDAEDVIFLKLIDALLTEDCDVFWENGTYTFEDIYNNMESVYGFGRIGGTWQRELPIGGNCRYYFNGSTIIGNMPSGVTDGKIFGTIRTNIGNYELHDGIFISNDMTYCIHDEGDAADGCYRHEYHNCKMEAHRTSYAVRCIGGGTGMFGSAIIDSCIFDGVDNTTDVAYHGITSEISEDADFNVICKNSYFKYGMQVNILADGQHGLLLYCGNSAAVAPSISAWESKVWQNTIR